MWCQAQGQTGGSSTVEESLVSGKRGASKAADLPAVASARDERKWEFVHLADRKLRSVPKRRGAEKKGSEGQNVQKALLEKEAGSANEFGDSGRTDASPPDQRGLENWSAADQHSGSQEVVGTSNQDSQTESGNDLPDRVRQSKGSDQRKGKGRRRSQPDEEGRRGKGKGGRSLTEGGTEEASLKREDAASLDASEEKREAAKRSLEAILAGLDQNAPKVDRARALDALTGSKGELEVEGSSTSGPSQRVQIATSSRLGELSADPSADQTAKWEETPVDVSWGSMGTAVSKENARPHLTEPQEFARELAELDGFPIGSLGVSGGLGAPVGSGLGVSEGVGEFESSGGSISRREARERAKRRSLSAQKVARTLAFLEGVSASHDRKLQNLYKEELPKSAAFQDGAEAVSIEKPVLELGELLTPLVGRLSTLELNKVLKGLGETGNWRMAVGVLRWMEAQPQCQPDEWSYSTVRFWM